MIELALSFRVLSEALEINCKSAHHTELYWIRGTWSYEGSNSEFILMLCGFIAFPAVDVVLR